VIFYTGSGVRNPAPIIGLFSSSPNSNNRLPISGELNESHQIKRKKKSYFSFVKTSFFIPTENGTPFTSLFQYYPLFTLILIGKPAMNLGMQLFAFWQGILKGEVSLYCWPPV
jgi:hypothetical protein